MEFKIEGNKFIKDGQEIKIISGAVHYFRNMKDTWRDIFKKMKAMGLNCVETYCAWNMHEKKMGEFDFTGNLDIAEFIRIAESEGLMAIVRPGPYICAEWEFGGLPWWLQTMDDMEIRCQNKTYMERFEIYLSQIFDQIRPLLSTNGGPIIMMQCENEYGYYGDDKEYLKKLYEIYRAHGIDVPLFTSDGTGEEDLMDGTIDGCLATLNFGSRVEENFKAHDKLFPDSPKMCMEMWNGWFDAWGDGFHHTTSAQDYASVVDEMLSRGSLNMYMLIGGTNFGFTSGANHYEKFAPDVTSYDYDAPLSECGDVTPKYMALREVIKKHTGKELPPVPANREKRAYGKVELTSVASLFDNLDNLSKPQFSNVPKCMEAYGQGYGYIAYTTKLNRDYNGADITFESIGDRAQVYVNRQLQGIVYVNDDELKVKITAKAGDTLTILVENMGRANFGPKMMRKKGIAGRLLLGRRIHFNWEVYTLPMDNLDKLEYGAKPQEQSCFYKGSFTVDKAADTFLYLDNFKKGFVLINGFNIGRYWEMGPQKSLYVPKSLLKESNNEIVVFESDGIKGAAQVELLDYPTLS
ncbi:MAG: beta-galactosidase [Ruminococcaceae bacterium]|nr:beta-galactosidase [Oscillospiraceae bacterium]